MGSSLSSTVGSIFCSLKEYQVLLLGLDNSGKTTIFNRLVFKSNFLTIPTCGCNQETLRYPERRINLSLWDIGGGATVLHGQGYRNHCSYYPGTDAIVFVVDSRLRIRGEEQVCRELEYVMGQEDLKDAVLLVCANKQDCKDAMSADKVSEALGLSRLPQNRKWHVQGTTAITGDGLEEGFEWLLDAIEEGTTSSPE